MGSEPETKSHVRWFSLNMQLICIGNWNISCTQQPLVMAGCGPLASLDQSLAVKTEITLWDLYRISDNSFALRNWLFKERLIGDYGGACDTYELGKEGLVKDSSKCDGYLWCCSHKSCQAKIQLRHGSWSEWSHLSLDTIMLLTYFWTNNFPQDVVQRELPYDRGLVQFLLGNLCWNLREGQ